MDCWKKEWYCNWRIFIWRLSVHDHKASDAFSLSVMLRGLHACWHFHFHTVCSGIEIAIDSCVCTVIMYVHSFSGIFLSCNNGIILYYIIMEKRHFSPHSLIDMLYCADSHSWKACKIVYTIGYTQRICKAPPTYLRYCTVHNGRFNIGGVPGNLPIHQS